MRVVLAALILAAAFTGCLGQEPATGPREDAPSTDPPDRVTQLHVTSAAFAHEEEIPRTHTCDGANTSPPLEVTGLPAGATLALIMEDPDVPVPGPTARTLDHWLLWDAVPANGTVTFPEDGVPPGATQGPNVGGENEYTGPCPPVGSPAHRYFFLAFAIDGALDLPEGSSREDLEAAMAGRVLGEAELVGLYARAILVGQD